MERTFLVVRAIVVYAVVMAALVWVIADIWGPPGGPEWLRSARR